MLCENPFIKCPTGITRKALVLSEEARQASTPFPCGKCRNCRINKANLWTTRLLLEQLTSEFSCFVTLTYDKDHLPENSSLCPEDVTLFLKRLRSYYPGTEIRYYYSGEYGLEKDRPHYHAALFGVPFTAKEIIHKAWRNGNIMVGDLTKDSAKYMCGYIIKGMDKENKYSSEYLRGRYPEFQRMSRRPGLGNKAVKLMAEKLYGKNINRVKVINIGHKKFYLGRYLQAVFDGLINVDNNDKEVEYWTYQEELFEKYFKDCGLFVDNMQSDLAQKRLQQVKRNKIFCSGRKK